MRYIVYILVLLPLALAGQQLTGKLPGSWWPQQQAPSAVVVCTIKNSGDARELNLAQSVSGLAAQAMNEGTSKEGVWISTPLKDYAVYYLSMLKRTSAKKAGSYSAWELAGRYKQNGIVKGYILYDYSRMDNSVNLATVYAGLLKGILVDISQEADAVSKGFVKLFDATKEGLDEAAFKQISSQLNRGVLVIANPQFSNNRDYAIAQKSMVYYGVDALLNDIVKWVRPLSPIVGWNKGDEFAQIEPGTEWGLINTASDWCMNLPLLSAGTLPAVKKVRSFDPKKIDWQQDRNYQAFVMSDGDNMQWTSGAFISSKEYWANPFNSELPMSFTTCVSNLVLAAPDVYQYQQRTQLPGTSVVEYGSGYYYPDLFAKATGDRETWLRAYAVMINAQLKKTGTKVFGFICKNVSSPAALEAYKIYAEELEDITGMIAVQYAPYNGGLGKIFWVKNKKGIEIPVVTAKYQLWSNLSKKGSGNPAALAQYINADNLASSPGNRELSWTIVHAWSRFSKGENGDITDADKKDSNGVRGVTPVRWTKELVDKGTAIVSIEELLWRIRMKHNAAETKKNINGYE